MFFVGKKRDQGYIYEVVLFRSYESVNKKLNVLSYADLS